MYKNIPYKFVIKSLLIFSFLVVVLYKNGIASEEHPTHENNNPVEEEFNPGDMMINHVIDAHDWHILDWKGKSVSIPLPIIIYDKDISKLHVFSSSKFHHGHAEYKGYMLAQKGANKGQIVKVKPDTKMEEDTQASLPIDLSITRVVAGVLFSMIILAILFISLAKTYRKRDGKAPKGMQNALEVVILFIRDDVAINNIGKDKYHRYMPFLLTLFFFILINNLVGLIPFAPFGTNVTGNISITATLAIFTFIIVHFSSNKYYWKHIFNTPGVPWWLKFPIPLMPVVELMSVFVKPFVLAVRLFANITAGHMVVLGFMSLIFIFGNMSAGLGYGISILSVIMTIFISLIEILVAFIQAYVFTLLSAVYIGSAIEEHH